MRYKLFVDFVNGQRDVYDNVSSLTAISMLLDSLSKKEVFSFTVERFDCALVEGK